MFFKNARLFQLTAPFEYSQDDLETMLSEQIFVPCSKYEKSRLGWVAPLEEPPSEDAAPMLTHVIGDYVMVCAQKQDRLLPASVVREVTDEKVAELEQRQARKVFRKERRQIQDDVYASLLPQAFTRSQLTYAYVSVNDRLLVVDAASAPRAEEVVNLLRDSLESFPVALPNSKRAPADVMTRWLKEGKAAGRFALHEDVELHNPLDSNNVVRCKGQDLTSEEVTAHLDAGKAVKSLGLLWGELLGCVIGDDLGIKRLRFETVDEETSDEVTPAQKFDQEMALMTLELSGFFSGLFEAFGGLADPKPLPRKDEE